MKAKRIRIFSSTDGLFSGLISGLKENGFETKVYKSGDDLLLEESRILKTPTIYLISDTLQGLSAQEMVKLIRRYQRISPIFIITTLQDPDTISSFLELGADDTFGASFHPDHLMQKILNAAQKIEYSFPRMLTLGLKVIPEASAICCSGRVIKVTRNEAQILQVLIQRPDEVVSREAIKEVLEGPVGIRTIDVHIANVRKKISSLELEIETARGCGYRIREPAPA